MCSSDTIHAIQLTVRTELDAQSHDYETRIPIFQYLAEKEVAVNAEAGWVSQNAGESLFRQQAGIYDHETAPAAKVIEQPTNVPGVERRKAAGRVRHYTKITRFARLAGGLRPKAWLAFKKRFV